MDMGVEGQRQLSFLAPSDVELLELMRYFVREAGKVYDARMPRIVGARIAVPADAFALLGPQMGHLPQEELRVLTLTTKHDVISSPTVYIGNVGCAVVRAAEVFRPAVLDGAPSIIVAHNHPSGDPAPSPEDVQITRKLVEAGKVLDIEVLDHMIISESGFVSLRERGLAF